MLEKQAAKIVTNLQATIIILILPGILRNRPMDGKKKEGRYHRIYDQLEELLVKTDDPLARMASVCAILHHKMDHYFWTGFYMAKEGRLVVGPYQGPVACQELEKDQGVCWAAYNSGEPVVVPDVHAFPGHIACDSRSKSEITLPVFDGDGTITAIFDVDSDQEDAFDQTDRDHLVRILELIHGSPGSCP
jgi:GAF domain-containing protein